MRHACSAVLLLSFVAVSPAVAAETPPSGAPASTHWRDEDLSRFFDGLDGTFVLLDVATQNGTRCRVVEAGAV